jgi:hypothetical protein
MSKVCETAKDFKSDKLEIRLITPAVARSLINSSEGEIKIAGRNIRRYANEIRIGLWNKPKHTVCIIGDKIKSGHEYLYGILEANIPAQLYFDAAPQPIFRATTGAVRRIHRDDEATLFHDGRVTTTKEFITPKIAAEYLSRNENRPLRNQWVDHLAQKMASGSWVFNHEGIAFDDDGNLVDGQHRLNAVIMSGATIEFLVTRGLSKVAKYSMDGGIIRTVSDVFSSLALEKKCPAAYTATATMMMSGSRMIKPKAYTKEFWINFILKYYAEIEFSVNSLNSRVGKNAAFRGVVARACRTQDKERLAEFCKVLSVGVGAMKDQGDIAAVLLRNHYLSQASRFSGNQERAKLYKKTEGALNAFLERRDAQIVREMKTELYPIDEDK